MSRQSIHFRNKIFILPKSCLALPSCLSGNQIYFDLYLGHVAGSNCNCHGSYRLAKVGFLFYLKRFTTTNFLSISFENHILQELLLLANPALESCYLLMTWMLTIISVFITVLMAYFTFPTLVVFLLFEAANSVVSILMKSLMMEAPYTSIVLTFI